MCWIIRRSTSPQRILFNHWCAILYIRFSNTYLSDTSEIMSYEGLIDSSVWHIACIYHMDDLLKSSVLHNYKCRMNVLRSHAHDLSSKAISYKRLINSSVSHRHSHVMLYHTVNLLSHACDIAWVYLCPTKTFISRPYKIATMTIYTVAKTCGWLSNSSVKDDNIIFMSYWWVSKLSVWLSNIIPIHSCSLIRTTN